MANNIAITISVNAQDVDAARKKFAMLREQGEKLRGLGMAISAGITLPIIAGGAALIKFGSDAKKSVGDASAAWSKAQDDMKKAQSGMTEASIGGDPEKIKAASDAVKEAQIGLDNAAQANRNISIATRETAAAHERLTEAMKPVVAELEKFQAEALTALVPILKESVPLLTGLARGATDLVKGFSALPEPSKAALIGVAGFGMALGPVVTLMGQWKWLNGTIGQQFPILAKGLNSVVYPLVAWAIAIKALIDLWKMDEWRQGLAALRGQVTLAVTGDKVKAAESALRGYKELGGGAAGSGDTGAAVRGLFGGGVPQQSTSNGVTVNYIDQSMVSTASPERAKQAAQIIGPLVQQAQQTQTGRR